MTTAPAPEALDAVRALERSLDVAAQGEMLAEQRLREARREAEVMLAGARRRGQAAAERVRAEALATARREIAAIEADAEAEIGAVRSRLDRDGDRLVGELLAIVLGSRREEAEA